MIKITILGVGNVAWHIAHICQQIADIQIETIYNHQLEGAKALVQMLNENTSKPAITYTDSLNLTHSSSDICLIALKDDALPLIIPKLQLPPDTIVAHTSGSMPINLFSPYFQHYGVWYPLQTFSKKKAINWQEIPICIEGNTKENTAYLTYLAQKISNKVVFLHSEQRKNLHIAAVIACNFVNHLWAKAAELMQQQNMGFEILQPLITETLQKALQLSPALAQTGPAKRKDMQILQEHKAYLAQNMPNLLPLYQLLTQSILDNETPPTP